MRTTSCLILLLAFGCREARLTSALEASPPSVDFGKVSTASAATRSLTLHNRGERPLGVTEARLEESPAGSFKLDSAAGFTLGPSESRTLAVTFEPRASGLAWGRLLLRGDADNTPELVVGLTGVGQESCSGHGCATPRDAGPDGGADAGWDAGHDAGVDAGACPRRWGVPVPVMGVNSPAEEAHATVSGDLLHICFTSDRPGGRGRADIWCARRASPEDAFGPPVNQVNLNTAFNDWMPDLSFDGAELFFASDRPGAGHFDLYRAHYSPAAGAFGTPTPVANVNGSSWESAPHLSRDSLSLYFDSNRPGGEGQGDIYVATRASPSAPFDPPVLVPAVNSPQGDGEPSTCGDKSVMVICSSRPDGGHLPPEIFSLWMSVRDASGWSRPVLADLQQPVGLGGCGPYLQSDGVLVFHSARDGGLGQGDLYMAAPR